MMLQLLSFINYWAILVSAIVYWVLGSLWFSVLFKNSWGTLIGKHGIKLSKPRKKTMIVKMVSTLILNFIVALGVAFFVYALGSANLAAAIVLGLIVGIFFSAATMAI